MDTVLNDLSGQAIIQAIEANLFELIKARNLWSRAEVRDDSEMLSCFTDVPYPHFNVVLRAQLPPEQVVTTIQSVVHKCRFPGSRSSGWKMESL
ncbi:MAG: hypothetical protein A2029_09140 [Chloroflexi bacterium RBG_19FT_COMBO_47_9]|jgi:hypothetical protein|nr:MAG: hypothetical protein A2029_09140 [Chloroflexi bacterium RBG_19FT_COMBO_47_9]